MKLIRLGRRQLHTIIYRETIKPSSPTPSHIHRYNLSLLDQLQTQSYQPLIMFYPNNDNSNLTIHEKVRVLKKSLSQSLTRYYPLAGRLPTLPTPYIDCNDEGVVFIEAETHGRLDQIQHDEPQDRLFPDGLVWFNSPCSKILLCVQLNHFSCGGIGLAVTMSHLIGDACSLSSFVNYWASLARYGSTECKEVLPLNPHIIHFPPTESADMIEAPYINKGHVTRKFVFPNSKLSDLKNKLVGAGSTLRKNSPTRVEVLTSLLYKAAVKAATTKGFTEPSYLIMLMNIRKNFVPKLPQTTLGNFWTFMMLVFRHTNETSLDVVIEEITKEKARVVEQVQSVELSVENNKSLMKKLGKRGYESVVNRSYICSSVCGFPYNKVDFGWGKPMVVTMKTAGNNGFLLMDTPHDDGIEATVTLEKDKMEIFANDKEMLSFCDIK